MKIVQQWLSVPQNYKYEEHKAKIPLIIHHDEKKQKNISDVKNKIVEHHK